MRTSGGASVRAGYTWLDTAVLAIDGQATAPSPFLVGEALIRRPRHQGFVEAMLARERFTVFARTTARGDVLDVDPTLGTFGGKVTGPGFWRTDVGGAVRAGARTGVEVFGRITNLFDRGHEEAFGFPAPGRAIVGGLRVDFRR